MAIKAIFAVVVGAASIVSAGALAFALTSPVVPAAVNGSLLAPVPVVVAADPTVAPPPVAAPIVVPVVITASAPSLPRHVQRTAAPPVASEPTTIHCTSWRGLAQGSTEQQVRSCD